MFSGRRPTSENAPDEDEFSAAALDFLVQDTFLKAIRARGRFSPGTNLKAWHYTILHNTWRNRQRDGAGDGAPISKADAEATIAREYGWSASVPASAAAEGVELVAVRHCLYGDGMAAHLLYRVQGKAVSLFIMPGLVRPAAELRVFGHDEVVWTQGDRTYMLVASAGTKAGLARVASYLRNEAR